MHEKGKPLPDQGKAPVKKAEASKKDQDLGSGGPSVSDVLEWVEVAEATVELIMMWFE